MYQAEHKNTYAFLHSPIACFDVLTITPATYLYCNVTPNNLRRSVARILYVKRNFTIPRDPNRPHDLRSLFPRQSERAPNPVWERYGRGRQSYLEIGKLLTFAHVVLSFTSIGNSTSIIRSLTTHAHSLSAPLLERLAAPGAQIAQRWCQQYLPSAQRIRGSRRPRSVHGRRETRDLLAWIPGEVPFVFLDFRHYVYTSTTYLYMRVST